MKDILSKTTKKDWRGERKLGRKTGIREVVESFNDIVKDIPTHTKVWAYFFEKWEAKLKEWGIRLCARCGTVRADNIDSDICGSCADDLRGEKEAHSGQANADTGTD